ncbi:MAG: hypothetical protein JXA19_04350 [Anaerolineales bacterium]|nr:hypothetical protein [Anaerolineales bacterium]
MQKEIVNRISAKVSKQFPEVKGINPTVTAQNSPQSKGMNSGIKYLLTFSTKATNIAGKVVPRIVRVTANENGEIIKISTSH